MPKSTVLVVHDESTDRDVLTFALKDAFAVTQTDNTRDAVRLAWHQHPDVVVLDLVLPGMNGHVAHQIKAHCPETAILAVSTTPTTVPPLDDNNFDMTLARPFDRTGLLNFVWSLCPEEWTNADESIW